MSFWNKIQRLWVRLLGSHVLLVVALALAMGGLVLQTAQDTLHASVLEGRQEVAWRASEEIFYFFNGPLGSLRTLAQAMNVNREDWRRQSLLSQVSLSAEALGEICLVDTGGRVRATSVLDMNAALKRDGLLPRGYVPDLEALWRTVSERSTYMSDTITSEGQPHIIMALPVVEGANVAALILRLELYSIWEKIDHIKLGGTGYSAIVNSQGRFIAHPARQRIYQRQIHPQAVHMSGSGIMEWRDEAGREWLTAYAPIAELGWTVIIEQEAAEAFGLIGSIRQRIAFIVLGAIAGAVILGFLLLRTITRPLDRLMQNIEGIRQGDLAPIWWTGS